MAVTTYTDLAAMKDWLNITKTTDDAKLTSAISAASRAVDNFCQRRFWLDVVPVARTFTPSEGLLYMDLWANDSGNDIGSAAGLVLAVDTSGDGTYEQVFTAADIQLLPVNAPYASPEPKPWTALRAVGTRTFPWLVNTWLTHLNRVQITALWGWPQIPDDVVMATKIKAARLFHRKDSPAGVSGLDNFGPIRISKSEDGDVVSLLTPYQYMSILVA